MAMLCDDRVLREKIVEVKRRGHKYAAVAEEAFENEWLCKPAASREPVRRAVIAYLGSLTDEPYSIDEESDATPGGPVRRFMEIGEALDPRCSSITFGEEHVGKTEYVVRALARKVKGQPCTIIARLGDKFTGMPKNIQIVRLVSWQRSPIDWESFIVSENTLIVEDLGWIANHYPEGFRILPRAIGVCPFHCTCSGYFPDLDPFLDTPVSRQFILFRTWGPSIERLFGSALGSALENRTGRLPYGHAIIFSKESGGNFVGVAGGGVLNT
jgi:hypothetical protein